MPISRRKINKPTVPNLAVDQRDGRYLTRTNRTVHFATKVTPEFDSTIRQLAHEQGCLITEMLEKFMEAYLQQNKIKDKAKNKKK